jgi:DegV family protein with EDD domain
MNAPCVLCNGAAIYDFATREYLEFATLDEVARTRVQTVLDAISLVDAGYSATECRRILEEGRSDMCIYIAVQTLDNLRRGGRISPAVATVGTLLNIKPILQLSTGKLDAYKKTRGMIKARETMLEAIRSDLAIRFREAQSEGRVQLLAAGSASPEETARWIAQIEASFPGMPVLYDDLSLGVSCHTGEGALGVGLSVRPRL